MSIDVSSQLCASAAGMTITYNAEVFTSRIGVFWKLLGRWRGSIYKLVWKELVVYILLYSGLSSIYRMVLTDYGKKYHSPSYHCCSNSVYFNNYHH